MGIRRQIRKLTLFFERRNLQVNGEYITASFKTNFVISKHFKFLYQNPVFSKILSVKFTRIRTVAGCNIPNVCARITSTHFSPFLNPVDKRST